MVAFRSSVGITSAQKDFYEDFIAKCDGKGNFLQPRGSGPRLHRRDACATRLIASI